MNVISEILIPKILASKCCGRLKLKGKLFFESINPIVVDPPKIILQNAAMGLLFFQNNAPNTGINNPDTIKA